jgi:ubiquinone/menaquinone biosynthesis C-methylase UbiE
VEALLREMHRVLRVGGTYLVMSHGLPDNRLSYFKRFLSCNISVLSIRKCYRP